MSEMERLQYVLFERFHRRAPGIDKLDRLWDAAVLLPLVRTEEGICVLFEERAHTLRRQPGEICFPGGTYECSDNGFRTASGRNTHNRTYSCASCAAVVEQAQRENPRPDGLPAAPSRAPAPAPAAPSAAP